MSEHPILFSGPMVNAILDGRKTQTRRVIVPQPPEGAEIIGPEMYEPCHEDANGILVDGKSIFGVYDSDGEWGARCPYGKPGDTLWVREATRREDWHSCGAADAPFPKAMYAADKTWVWDVTQPCDWFGKRSYKPPMHMPRGWSRITLKVTAMRVERVQAISGEDCIGEGAADGTNLNMRLSRTSAVTFHEQRARLARADFQALWDSINGNRKDKHGKRLPYAWADNPYVWVVEFERER